MNKKILMVAFDYQPSKSVAGQRTLRMTQYLPEFGWDPIILTAKTSAYDGLDYSQEVPEHMQGNIYRTAALDVDRHLSIKGKHFAWMKTIDRWSSWIPGAIIKGLKIIKQRQPDVIWSTYPTMSAHIVANVLAKRSNIPLVIDYQDPLAYIHKDVPALKKKVSLKVDKAVLARCHQAVFATEQAKEAYINYHKPTQPSKFSFIENGYDESNFARLDTLENQQISPFCANKFSLYYSGVLYPDGRNPIPTFKALSRLKEEGMITEHNFELIFQGAGDGANYATQISSLNLDNIVKFIAPVPFLNSLKNMIDASALLLIQDAVFNLQVPGKLFEYIRAMKPVLVAAPQESATAQVARKAHCGEIAHSDADIYQALKRWLANPPSITHSAEISQYSRYEKARQLAELLNKNLVNK